MRVGWLSGDLRAHVIAQTILPIIRNLDGMGVSHHFYSDVPREDEYTETFKSIAAGWRDVRGIPDKEACGIIRADNLDALFLLAPRCDENRPFFGALRAAPVQISLHDNATSALANMDYFLADRFLVPRRSMARYSERVIRFPSFYVHAPIENAPEVSASPCLASGSVAFGCFNNPAKISDATLDLWAKILKRVRGSRLVLKYRDAFDNPHRRSHLLSRLNDRAIKRDRVSFLGQVPGRAAHLADYQSIDIALDTFPYNGVTTTFEALWMGVPVITLAGETVASRQGGSMLRTLRLGAWASTSPETCVDIAVALARDTRELSDHRKTLRQRLRVCPGS